MKRKAMVLVIGGLGLGLGACGGGGGDGGGAPSGPVPLASKADALRELNLALGGNGAVKELLEPQSPAAAAQRKRAKESDSGSCDDGGSYSFSDGTESHNFPLFGVNNVTVSYQRGTLRNCTTIMDFGEGFRTTYISNGSYDEGFSTTAVNGANYRYESSPGGYSDVEEDRQGSLLLLRDEEASSGSIELKTTASAQEIRALGSFSFAESGSEATPYSADFYFGDDTAHPFQIISTSNSLVLNGSYAYSSSECAGGKVIVSTPGEGGIALDDGGYPVGGKLQLKSGSNTALFTFSPEGGATLQLNDGTAAPVSEDVQEALEAAGAC